MAINNIVFIDTEVEPRSKKVLEFGAIKPDGSKLHNSSVQEFTQFLRGTDFICGHNIIKFDLKYIGAALQNADVIIENTIDTLPLSPLLFPTKPYHKLVKDDKLQSEDANNPLNDAIKAKELFDDEVSAFNLLDNDLQDIYYLLLHETDEFKAFFNFICYAKENTNSFSALLSKLLSPDKSTKKTEQLIRQRFAGNICEYVDLQLIIKQNPIELAYCLSLIQSFIDTNKTDSTTPRWVVMNYPEVEQIMIRLRDKPCVQGCMYCNKALDVHIALKHYFGYDAFRTYAGESLQENAVKAAVYSKSLLAIFPTGGGKSLTFQMPALMSGNSVNGLTVVISPLQSLMKDQVDNLERIGINTAVTINGLLDPIERAKSFERVADGSASLLYISPESLRSKTIEHLLLGRNVVRFVIDEAHCFSSWGQDFRVDYLYIGDFIKSLQEKKNLSETIPVSCFTATAKQLVIEDICNYFSKKLNIDLELFTSKATRTNLTYKVLEEKDDNEKYQALRRLVEQKDCPTIVYVSRTHRTEEISKRLNNDGFNALHYHGKMRSEDKITNQNSFINGDTQIMVATNAFGMGVDKKDVGLVVHYDISDSLENYVQEAGRAGRDENLNADCYVLFNEGDLDKHFILLNQTKLNIKEIQQVWSAVKYAAGRHSKFSKSALELARAAGWDDSVDDIETRIKTAIAALETSGYLKRGQNMPRVYANSIQTKNAQEAIDKIMASEKFQEKQKQDTVRIIKSLFSSRSRKAAQGEEPESRIDYLSDNLGIAGKEVITSVNLMREEGILADNKDLTAYIQKGDNHNRSLKLLGEFAQLEDYLLTQLDEENNHINIKEINENAESLGCKNVSPSRLITLINIWNIKHWIKSKHLEYSKNDFSINCLQSKEQLKSFLNKRKELAEFVVNYLYYKYIADYSDNDMPKDEVLVEFSVLELKDEFYKQQGFFVQQITLADVEDALFYLSRIGSIKIEGGFLVVYNKLQIERLEQNNRIQYKADDYARLAQFYDSKVQQIHIVGEYAKKMIQDYDAALRFVDDYFQLNYDSFLRKYFNTDKQKEIKRNITAAKFRQLFGELSPTQLSIINDKGARYVVVLAGPGSGKTKVLVHKLASLLLMEDVKHEQLLMLTFSRAAATEFKQRLIKLIGNAAHFVDIKTFHSYCFDLLGKVGSLEKSNDILKHTIEKINNGEIEPNKIAKSVLVIDEAQDMDADEFDLVRALISKNDEMRVIAVGDDDQNIYQFRGSSSDYMKKILNAKDSKEYELIDNYRAKSNLVAFANKFADTILSRLKSTPIVSRQAGSGKIKVIKYLSPHLIVPLVSDVCKAEIRGTTCILTHTNKDAMQITGLLLRKGIKAKLIQSNDKFNLYNLLEVRYFIDSLNLAKDVFTISDETWENGKKRVLEQFGKSTNIDTCLNIIKAFESVNTKAKYKTDLEVFIRESKLEDFFTESNSTIFVSTIHKAKGREFDNVYIMLDNFDCSDNKEKRELYVAITRAKTNLTIHLNTNIFDNFKGRSLSYKENKNDNAKFKIHLHGLDNFTRIDDNNIYTPPNEIVAYLTHKDVWLDYPQNIQETIATLMSGDSLIVCHDGCLSKNGQYLLKFSQSYIAKIQEMAQQNYQLKSAKINFIIYWKAKENKHEIKTILPKLYFVKPQND